MIREKSMFLICETENAKWIGALCGASMDDSYRWMIAERWYFTSYTGRIVQPNSLKYSHHINSKFLFKKKYKQDNLL